MCERDLNSRQMRFVAAVAQGKTQRAAYEEAGYVCGGKPGTTARNARRLAQNPQVRAAIREMRRQVLPAPDIGACYQQLLTSALKLAETASDDKTRLGALQWAGATLEKIRKLKEAARTAEQATKPEGAEKPEEEREQIIAELRSIYASALPRGGGGTGSGKRRGGNSGCGSRRSAESGAELLAEIRRPREEEDPEPPAPQVRYIEKCISKPGHFPPRFVRIAVRTPPSPDAT
jgi:phage terminase small subunit